jgi:hypothetical protein
MMSPTPELTFKYRHVRRDGQVGGLFAHKGTAGEQGLQLKKEMLSYDDIFDTTVRDNRLIMAVSPRLQSNTKLSGRLVEGQMLALEVYKVKAKELEKFIDRTCSKRAALRHRERLIQEGRGDQFRATKCPACEAIIDVSELDPSPYLYCRFCETVFTPKRQIVTNGETHCLCDECGMFAQVRGYTEFYFYFLLVAYGFSYKRRFVCDTCANKIFWKTLLANLIFVLGVPVSIYAKIKSMLGRDPNLKRLSKANALALKGQHQEAAALYQRFYQKYPEHPGLRMNEGIGRLAAGDVGTALKYFERALKACSNYLPAAQWIRRIQER